MTRAIAALLLAAILAAAGWAIHETGLAAGRAEIQAKWDQQRITDAAATVQAAIQARAREQALQSTADKIRQEKTREIRHLSAARDAALRELRDRPEARAGAGGVPSTSELGNAGCTGEGLAKGDAEFLTRYASDAARLELALSQCRSTYEAAVRYINNGFVAEMVCPAVRRDAVSC